MKDISKLVRPNIRGLVPYSSARDEYKGTSGIFLDANENPFGRLNRYPDPHQTLLRQKLGELKSVDPSKIFIGNGSDEIIDLTFRIFCTPGKDKALSFNPTYGMYEVAAAINDVEMIKISLNESYQLDTEILNARLSDNNLKLVIICSPNNPTGNIIENIDKLIENFSGIVLVDEAYIDFSQRDSLISLIEKFPNLIVCQTFSKAYGLAGARVGVAYAAKAVIDLYSRVKPPYNVSWPDQKAALEALDSIETTRMSVEKILAERHRMESELLEIQFVKKIWPSDANFLLIEVDDADKIYERLRSENIIIRNRSKQISNTLRITVGTAAENIRLINALKMIEKERSGLTSGEDNTEINEKTSANRRSSRIVRTTTETSIVIDLNLDGNGTAFINTGIGFFDHMLNQLAKHGGFDIDISASGDINVDQHHIIEDVALTLGEAFDRALGSRKGIERYGFMIPMDDALAQVAIDFGGRPYLVWDAVFNREYIGEMPTELIQHFFRSFTEKARCNLNIKADGFDEHHKAEAVFKAFARAARMAVKTNGMSTVPSTKGIL